jgi:hypothetical protein
MSAIVLWKDPFDGKAFVPLFSAPARVPDGRPPNVQFAWDSLSRLAKVLPEAHFRLNPAGPVMYELPPELARALGSASADVLATASATWPAGSDLSIGHPADDHRSLIAALRSHFHRQASTPAIYLYELYRPEGGSMTHSLALGVVSGFDASIANAIAAIVPDAYEGRLPVDIAFLGDNPEVVDAIVGLAIEPIVQERASRAPQ